MTGQWGLCALTLHRKGVGGEIDTRSDGPLMVWGGQSPPYVYSNSRLRKKAATFFIAPLSEGGVAPHPRTAVRLAGRVIGGRWGELLRELWLACRLWARCRLASASRC
jgi:hypothetical protein